MFDSNIEKKIIRFVKESPIGVTSSEIAKYLNVNRMTMTKYLAVIKEKSLIDFKQLGMAKLWFVPVEINKEDFLKNIITQFAAHSNDHKSIDKAASKVADNICELYRQYYDVEKMNVQQVTEAIADAHEKIGGQAEIEVADKNRIRVRISKCPFGDNVKMCKGLCSVTSNLFGRIASNNLGYSKVNTKTAIAEGSDHCIVDVHLRHNKEEGKEFKN